MDDIINQVLANIEERVSEEVHKLICEYSQTYLNDLAILEQEQLSILDNFKAFERARNKLKRQIQKENIDIFKKGMPRKEQISLISKFLENGGNQNTIEEWLGDQTFKRQQRLNEAIKTFQTNFQKTYDINNALNKLQDRTDQYLTQVNDALNSSVHITYIQTIGSKKIVQEITGQTTMTTMPTSASLFIQKKNFDQENPLSKYLKTDIASKGAGATSRFNETAIVNDKNMFFEITKQMFEEQDDQYRAALFDGLTEILGNLRVKENVVVNNKKMKKVFFYKFEDQYYALNNRGDIKEGFISALMDNITVTGKKDYREDAIKAILEKTLKVDNASGMLQGDTELDLNNNTVFQNLLGDKGIWQIAVKSIGSSAQSYIQAKKMAQDLIQSTSRKDTIKLLTPHLQAGSTRNMIVETMAEELKKELDQLFSSLT